VNAVFYKTGRICIFLKTGFIEKEHVGMKDLGRCVSDVQQTQTMHEILLSSLLQPDKERLASKKQYNIIACGP